MLGIFDAEDDAESNEMTTALTAASKIDRKAMKENDQAAEIIREIAKGAEVDTDSETKTTVLKWIKKIRSHYAGHVIRRTMDSKDNTGQAICELIPMQNHNLVVKLFDYEMQHLEHIAEKLTEEKPQGGVMFAGGKVSIALQMTFFRPGCPS